MLKIGKCRTAEYLNVWLFIFSCHQHIISEISIKTAYSESNKFKGLRNFK